MISKQYLPTWQPKKSYNDSEMDNQYVHVLAPSESHQFANRVKNLRTLNMYFVIKTLYRVTKTADQIKETTER